MAIADKLTELQATKTAIKTAIENKGQDLSGVPFTEYASKIDAIQGGSSDVYSVAKLLNAKKSGSCTQFFMDATNLTNDELFGIFSQVDSDFAPTAISGMFNKCSSLTKVPLFDTSRASAINEFCNACTKLKEVPAFDLSNAQGLYSLFANCKEIEEIPLLKITPEKVGSAHYMFYNCRKLKKIPQYDLRNATRLDYFSIWCVEITEIWIKNIKVNYQVGSGTSWGHLLTPESLIHLIYELRDTGSSKTLTVGSANLNKLANVYVRTIDITDEMRAEDDLIDEKLPFEVCESTDDGATLIVNYAKFKNWNIN